MMMQFKQALTVGALVLGTGFAQAGTVVTTFRLGDHPAGNAAEPFYGLRLDNLFEVAPNAGTGAVGMGANGGVTSFSFSESRPDDTSVKLTVTDSTMDGGGITLNIAGRAYGGEDDGSGYGFGEGFYNIDFTYGFNVLEGDGGWMIDPQSASNLGTITAEGNGDVDAGATWTFYEQVITSNPFLFVPDGHRLGAGGTDAGSSFVGRGWVTYNEDGSNFRGVQDWLFVVVPTPSAALAAIPMLGMIGLRRRRRQD